MLIDFLHNKTNKEKSVRDTSPSNRSVVLPDYRGPVTVTTG